MSYMLELFREMVAEKALLEAEDEETTSSEETTNEDQPATEEKQNDEAEKTESNDEENDNSEDDDFSLDTDLDSSEDDGDEGGDSSPSYSSDNSEEDEVNEDNTDLFIALSAEEQKIKIMELKRLYQDLFNSCNESLEIINNIETTEQNLYISTKITAALQDLKKYISDYLIYSFPTKSYVENDIMFNRFLFIIKSISSILDKFIVKIDKDDSNN